MIRLLTLALNLKNTVSPVHTVADPGFDLRWAWTLSTGRGGV